VVHERPAQIGRTTFGDHGVIGWTIGPALDHYRHWDFYIPKTRGARVSDTVVFFPEKYSMTTTASADRASTALEELTEALKNPAAAKPFLNTGNKLNAAIEALTERLSNRSTTPPNSGASPPRVSERTVQPPRVNNTRAVSPVVAYDPKQALLTKINPQVAVRGFNKIISTRAPSILNSTNNINKATSVPKPSTSIPTRLVNNNNNVNDNNNIKGIDNVTPGWENSEENSEENSPRRRLRQRIIPKTQKLELNTTVYKIFKEKIHQGYICEFDPKDGSYKIKYQDGDIEEGTEEEISRLLKKPNQTAWTQALSATIFERAHAQYCKTEERMPIPLIFFNGYGKAVAILEYQGGKADAFIPDKQEYKYQANAVINEETGKAMEYRDLLKDPKHRETWSRAAANEHGRLFNGTQRVKGTNTCRWIKKSQVPKGKRATYARTVMAVRPKKAETNRVRITVGGNLLEYLGETSTEAASIDNKAPHQQYPIYTRSATWNYRYIELLHPKIPERLPEYALPHQHDTTRNNR
jgi:hypothetical protein